MDTWDSRERYSFVVWTPEKFNTMSWSSFVIFLALIPGGAMDTNVRGGRGGWSAVSGDFCRAGWPRRTSDFSGWGVTVLGEWLCQRYIAFFCSVGGYCVGQASVTSE